MKIKDIVNRDIVNLTNCEHEPIHIPGSIQPHGLLIAFGNDRVIRFCSGNSGSFTGTAFDRMLGNTFGAVFGKENDDAFSAYLLSEKWKTATPFVLNTKEQVFMCAVHQSGDMYVVEAELQHEAGINTQDLYTQTRRFTDYMQQSRTLKELCSKVAEETRHITGYDRVMIYRFDKEYNGEVFAESRRDDLEPFLGLHYPHTDIPSQARELYLRNLMRLIVDTGYEPVPVYTTDDGKLPTLDLSLSTLRSVSPIHIRYLQNMGVTATLTISLIHNGRLWGLIACHHYSPKYISPETRLAAKLQGHFLTSQIDIRQLNEEYETAKIRNLAAEQMMSENLPPEYESFATIAASPALLELADAAGVAILINGKIYKAGRTFDDAEIIKLIATLEKHSTHGQFHTSKLADIYPPAEDSCDKAAGVLYHMLGKSGSGCIIWFRPETRDEVNWAGDPSKAIEKDEKGLSPRKSFESWKQVIKCQSREWQRPELEAAARYAYTLQKHVSLLFLGEEERRYRKVAEELQETNAELENINWISTHDLQEPLRKIQMMTSFLLYKDAVPENLLSSVNRINEAANHMQTLLKDILSYTRFRNNDEIHKPTHTGEILNEALHELKDEIRDKQATVITDPLPDVKGIAFLLKQLFLNLLRNALKFSSPGRQPLIYITTNRVLEGDRRFHRISISDNGIGFDPQYAVSIFRIFTRLHPQETYNGSGIGLALCKKIMQKHDGFIEAEGEPEKGATFHMYFPVDDQ